MMSHWHDPAGYGHPKQAPEPAVEPDVVAEARQAYDDTRSDGVRIDRLVGEARGAFADLARRRDENHIADKMRAIITNRGLAS